MPMNGVVLDLAGMRAAMCPTVTFRRPWRETARGRHGRPCRPAGWNFSPTLIPGPSPRNTVLNQSCNWAPMSTSPINAAFGALNADAATRGVKPLKGTISPDIETLSPQKEGALRAQP